MTENITMSLEHLEGNTKQTNKKHMTVCQIRHRSQGEEASTEQTWDNVSIINESSNEPINPLSKTGSI